MESSAMHSDIFYRLPTPARVASSNCYSPPESSLAPRESLPFGISNCVRELDQRHGAGLQGLAMERRQAKVLRRFLVVIPEFLPA